MDTDGDIDTEPEAGCFVDALLAMPDVGDDADFERLPDLPRELDLR